MKRLGYVAHIELAQEILKCVTDKTPRILDCASGTGFLGEEVGCTLYYTLTILVMFPVSV